MVIAVNPDGSIEFVYHDELRELLGEGAARVVRASRVEPTPAEWNSPGWWTAEIIGGPALGPFQRRDQAIAAEVEWIEAHLGESAREAAT